MQTADLRETHDAQPMLLYLRANREEILGSTWFAFVVPSAGIDEVGEDARRAAQGAGAHDLVFTATLCGGDLPHEEPFEFCWMIVMWKISSSRTSLLRVKRR